MYPTEEASQSSCDLSLADLYIYFTLTISRWVYGHFLKLTEAGKMIFIQKKKYYV